MIRMNRPPCVEAFLLVPGDSYVVAVRVMYCNHNRKKVITKKELHRSLQVEPHRGHDIEATSGLVDGRQKCPKEPQQGVPGKPVSASYGLLSITSALLRSIVAHHFELLYLAFRVCLSTE